MAISLPDVHSYGKFAQSTYDNYDFDTLSATCGKYRYEMGELLNRVGLSDSGYRVTKYLYATMADLPLPLPHWVLRSLRQDSWSQDSNWMGFVAVSDERETERLGRRNILVVWRGTCEPSEWFKNVHWSLRELEQGQTDVKVQNGFLSIFTSTSTSCRYTEKSAREQVKEEIKRLIEEYQGEGRVLSLTITGHSLGGALALLTAYAVVNAQPQLLQPQNVRVVSFGAPRVGNTAFCDKLNGVTVQRVVTLQDVVPWVPGLFRLLGYKHAGVELMLNMQDDPDLRYGWLDLAKFHSMKTYLRLVEKRLRAPKVDEPEPTLPTDDGVQYRSLPRDIMVDLLRVREYWCQLVEKGLVQGPPAAAGGSTPAPVAETPAAAGASSPPAPDGSTA